MVFLTFIGLIAFSFHTPESCLDSFSHKMFPYGTSLQSEWDQHCRKNSLGFEASPSDCKKGHKLLLAAFDEIN